MRLHLTTRADIEIIPWMSRFVYLLSAIIFLRMASGFSFHTTERPDLERLFDPQSKGWLGADVSTSIHLYNATYLWLWGDTLVGTSNGRTRNITSMPHSTLAIVDFDKSPDPQYFIPRKPSGDVDGRGFFYPPDWKEGKYYWIVAGSMAPASRQLVILAMVIVSTKGSFYQTATDIIVVKNPFDSPFNWTWHTYRMPFTTDLTLKLSYNIGITFQDDDSMFYIVGSRGKDFTFLLSRIPETPILTGNFSQMQFWNGRSWDSDFSQSAPIVTGMMYSESTLFFSQELGLWYMFLSQAYLPDIKVAFADTLTGPWKGSSFLSLFSSLFFF